MKIAVAGATGTIGTKICTELEKRGHQVVPLSRSTGVDASVLESLTPALAGVDVVIDALNHTVMNRRKAEELFKLTASNIAQAAAENQVKRIVCISIAGVQDAAVCRGYGYYSGKAVQENTYKASPVETVIIHSAQWFEILPTLVKQVTFGPVSVLPTMKMSPLPAAPVAQLACDIAEGQMNIPDSGVISIRGGGGGRLGGDRPPRQPPRGSGGTGPRARGGQLPYLGSAIAKGGLIPDPADRTDPTTLNDWLTTE